MSKTAAPRDLFNLFDLVHRLGTRSPAVAEQRWRNGASTLDSQYRLDYMGSVEFEVGDQGKSLARMRANSKNMPRVHRILVTRGEATDVPIYILADQRHIEVLDTVMNQWLAQAHPASKEQTYFHQQVDGTAETRHLRTKVWWDIRNDVLWTLDPDIAERLLDDVLNEARAFDSATSR